MPKSLKLLEPPTGKTQALDDLAMLNELILAKREELSLLKHDLEITRAKITSERVQWSSQRSEEDQAFRVKVDQAEAAYAHRMQQLEDDIEQANLVLQNHRSLEAAAEARVLEASQKLDEINTRYAQERLEIQTLKQQIEARMADVDAQEAGGREALGRGQDALQQAQRLSQETQQRLLAINEWESIVTKREDAVLLREHQVERLEEIMTARTAQQQEATDVKSLGRIGEHPEGLGDVTAAEGSIASTDRELATAPQADESGIGAEESSTPSGDAGPSENHSNAG